MSTEPSSLEQIVRDAVLQHLPGARRAGAVVPQNAVTGTSACDLPGALSLKRKLAAGEVTYGIWITLESPSLTEIAARLGFDWVVIDAEHGHLDLKVVMEHIRVANLSGLTALVRSATSSRG